MLVDGYVKQWQEDFDWHVVKRGIDHGATEKYHTATVPYYEPYRTAVENAAFKLSQLLTGIGWLDVKILFEEVNGSQEVRRGLLQFLCIRPPTMVRDVWDEGHREMYIQVTRPASR